MEYIILNNQIEMPILGLGVFQVPDKKECQETVFQAIKMCIRDRIDTLNEILNYPAVALLPGHTRVLWQNEIKAIVGTFRDAIEDILFKTLDCMNQGMSLEETVKNVKLAPIYQDKEYLGEYYGTVEWSVKSIYNGYVGWFDGDPVKLLPHPTEAYNRCV